RPLTCREFVEDLTGHSTRKLMPVEAGTVQDNWYLKYTDEEAVLHTVKGTLGAIRRSLKEGRLGDASNVQASRSKMGPFEPLRNHPEFRDLVIVPAALPPPQVKKSSAQNPLPAAETAPERPVTQIPLGPM